MTVLAVTFETELSTTRRGERPSAQLANCHLFVVLVERFNSWDMRNEAFTDLGSNQRTD